MFFKVCGIFLWICLVVAAIATGITTVYCYQREDYLNMAYFIWLTIVLSMVFIGLWIERECLLDTF